MKKQFLVVFALAFVILSMQFALAETNTYAPVKQGECINITQTCGTCTYMNVSVIHKGTTLINTAMNDQGGGIWIYNYCGTSDLGRYDTPTCGDIDGIFKCTEGGTIWFEVTPSGFTGTLGFYFVIIAVLAGLLILGFSIKDGWFVVFGGMGLIGLGIFSFVNGIAGFKDTLVTQGTSLFFIGVGAYLAINAALEMMNE